MANKILHYRSSTASQVPSAGSLDYGELAINYADKKLFIKDASNNVVEVGQDQAAMSSDLLPDVDDTRSLGSATKQWKDVFIGPGSLYVNGTKVLEESGSNIVVSADLNQNLAIQTTGSGDVEFFPTGTGVIQMKGTLSVLAGKNLTSSDANPISVAVGFDMNGEKIADLATPTLASDAATKDYVDTRTVAWANVTDKPDPVITVNGDASGSVTLTDLANGTLTLTIADDSHNHTIANVDGLQTALNGKAETASANTFANNQVIQTSSSDAALRVTQTGTGHALLVEDSANPDSSPFYIDNAGNCVIAGNLTVNGTTTTVNSNVVDINDSVLTLNADETGTPSQNAGIEVERGTSSNVQFFWDEANDHWTTGSSAFQVQDANIKMANSSAAYGPWLVSQVAAGGLQWNISSTGGAEMYLASDGADHTTAVLNVAGNKVLTDADSIDGGTWT